VQAAQKRTFQPTVSLFGQFLHVQRIHKAMDCHEHICLFTLGVNALRHSNHAESGETQLFEELHRIRQAARDAARIIYQDYVKGSMG
jgi:hypothetical protein